MIHIVYIFFLLFISIFIELFLGSAGIIFPLTALSIFYLSVVYDVGVGLCLATIAGTVIDLLYGRTLIITPFALMIVSASSLFWRQKGELNKIHFQFIPGIMVSIIYTLPPLAINFNAMGGNIILFFEMLGNIIYSAAIGAIVFPVLIVILDSLNSYLKIDLYSKTKERVSRRS